MKYRANILALLLLICISMGSCSSIGLTAATWPHPRPFKGSTADFGMVVDGKDQKLGWAIPVLAFVDFPLSLGMDILLLPVNLGQWIAWDGREFGSY